MLPPELNEGLRALQYKKHNKGPIGQTNPKTEETKDYMDMSGGDYNNTAQPRDASKLTQQSQKTNNHSIFWGFWRKK